MSLSPPNNFSGYLSQTKHTVVMAALFCFFLAGFVVGEDSMGGGIRIDLYQFHGPTMFALRERPWGSVLRDYSSATTPLFHMIESFNPLLGHDTAFRAANVVLALLTVLCFVVALSRRFKEEPRLQGAAMLLGGSVLLSPYFRAESYWVTTDVMPIFFLLLMAYLLIPTQDRLDEGAKPRPLLILAIAVLSWSTFYCRQTYLFAPVYACVLLVERYRRQSWWIAGVFGLLALPAIALFAMWKGFNPPQFQHHERLSRNGIVAPLSMIFIYALPFIAEAAISRREQMLRSAGQLKRLLPAIAGAWLVFLLIFHRYRFDNQNRGGGILSRVLSRFGTPGAFLFLTFGFLGLLVVAWLFRTSTWRVRLLLVLFLLPAMAMSLFFQRYYDPLLLLLFFLFAERSTVLPFLTPRMAFLLMGFNGLLLAGALLYNGREKPVFLPLNSVVHPWDGTALDGRVH